MTADEIILAKLKAENQIYMEDDFEEMFNPEDLPEKEESECLIQP